MMSNYIPLFDVDVVIYPNSKPETYSTKLC